jgi:hypothetical protein
MPSEPTIPVPMTPDPLRDAQVRFDLLTELADHFMARDGATYVVEELCKRREQAVQSLVAEERRREAFDAAAARPAEPEGSDHADA